MYEYLTGIFIIFIIWSLFFILRKDLRWPMVWSGLVYFLAVTALFFIPRFLSRFFYVGNSVVPGYWNPNTLFNLGRITGGYAIEDVLFMFFVGGIAAAIYEFFFHKRIRRKATEVGHLLALAIGLASALLFLVIFKPNWFYSLVVFGMVGAVAMWLQRRDLIKHSFAGGAIFTALYFLAFILFNKLFPYFTEFYYNTKNLSGILVLGVPIEELLYASSFGIFWAPLYEYEHGEKVANI